MRHKATHKTCWRRKQKVGRKYFVSPFDVETVANFHLIYRSTKLCRNKDFQYTSSNEINWAYYGISYKLLVSAIYFHLYSLFFGNDLKKEEKKEERDFNRLCNEINFNGFDFFADIIYSRPMRGALLPFFTGIPRNDKFLLKDFFSLLETD